jgi:nitroreductase/dihydropteridine reductase
MTNYIEKLNWRYATKRMNNTPVADDKLNRIVEAIQLAPTSLGLQPFKLLVIKDAATRAKIAPAIYNQPQITEGAAVLVFAVWENAGLKEVDAYINQIAAERNAPLEALADFKGMILGAIDGKTPAELQLWFAKQAYIALGFGLVAAAFEGVDTTPMEGFDPAALDLALGLNEKGLKSAVVLAVGNRDEANDYLVNAKKVRRPQSEFVEVI